MSLALVEHEPTPSQDTALSCAYAVERTAFYFESDGHSLFAWLHRPSGTTATHGVLICPPVGHEQVHSHRALRHLANALAAQGFAVLRIDYHGTGDSDGSDHDALRCATWQANIRDAASWLRDTLGCQRVSLIGLRMGATLAALYAESHEVENLVLWAPIMKGKRYVRELTALHRTAKQSADPGSSIEAVGFVFTQETAHELTNLDLTSLAPRFRRGLIVQSDCGPKDSLLFDHLMKLGTAIEQRALPGYEQMMAEPQSTEVPHEALMSIASWMLGNEGWDHKSEAGLAPSELSLASSMVTSGPPLVRESVHRISATPDLFGIITERTDSFGSMPWIVMLNGGAANRIGPGRMHVQLARHLASLGFPCLRMDISGLGDSQVDQGRAENDTYPATAFRDIALACDYLRQRQPARSIILMGLCSGAYAAFQSAAQLPHPALIECIMLNPLTFFWKEGMSLTASPTQQLQAWHYYWGIIFDPKNWRQLFSAESELGLKGAVQRFFQRVFPRGITLANTTTTKHADSGPYAKYAHPAKEDLTADLNRVVSASRQMTMFVSDGDPGHFLLMYKARRKATQLIRDGKLRCFAITDADHTFSTESSRAALSQSLTDYLHSRFGSSSHQTSIASIE